MITRWLVSVLKSFLVDISGLFIVPVALLMGGLNNRLPLWAQRWDNDREPFGDNAREPDIKAATGLKKLWLRYVWLALRNPGNNYGYSVGFPQVPHTWYAFKGDIQTSDQGHPGWKLVKAYQDGEWVAFEFYLVWAWAKTRCLRVRLGWKIDDNVYRKIEDGSMAQIVCVINPFMTYENGSIPA